MRTQTVLIAAALLGLLAIPASAQEKKPISLHSPAELFERTQYQRAIEAVIWGMPAVNYELMFQAMVKNRGPYNQIVYWSGLPSWKNQTLTPNPDTIYLMPFVSTKDDGPVVLEIPPADEGSITGTIMDAWQCALVSGRVLKTAYQQWRTNRHQLRVHLAPCERIEPKANCAPCMPSFRLVKLYSDPVFRFAGAPNKPKLQTT